MCMEYILLEISEEKNNFSQLRNTSIVNVLKIVRRVETMPRVLLLI